MPTSARSTSAGPISERISPTAIARSNNVLDLAPIDRFEWRQSFALDEEAITDRRSGRIVNANLAEYHIPVNADVGSLDVITIDEQDPHVNALGIKGVGEIGITGSAGAVANAVWHATGVRVQRFPIRIDDLLRG